MAQSSQTAIAVPLPSACRDDQLAASGRVVAFEFGKRWDGVAERHRLSDRQP
jgi:hypothetical protein